MANDVIATDLTKHYGPSLALSGVSFSVGAGEIFGLLGRNGAGKTTAIECIVGLRNCDSGSVQLCGLDALSNRRQASELIGVQLQATALQDKVTPREALRLFASFYARPAKVGELIERFNLGEKADAAIDTLSGGQRQRLALALALVNQPRVLFLDEPTAGLDPQSRRQLHEMIQAMRAEGRTVVLSTHYIEEAENLCDRLAIIDRGKIVAAGKPEELISAARGGSRIEVRTAKELDETFFAGVPGLYEARKFGRAWRVRTDDVATGVSGLVRKLEMVENDLIDLHVRRASLEDVFVELTGEEAQPDMRRSQGI
jgi:ABC-2 type transport system ATP-binding protein